MKIKIIDATFGNCKVYQTDTSCKIVCGKEKIGWHLSISHPTRYPSWDEIKQARYELIPNNVMVAMLFPPKEQFVNIHNNCFHLFEIHDYKLI